MIYKSKSKSLKNLIIKTALAAALINVPVLANSSQSQHAANENEITFSHYSKDYLNALDEINIDEFDQTFINIYRHGTYSINDSKYNISELYIVVTENGNHIIKAGENNYDILTNQTFNEKQIKIECLKRTSVFYKLYLDGIINSENISVDINTLKNYIEKWDMKNHHEVPELLADMKARENIKKR